MSLSRGNSTERVEENEVNCNAAGFASNNLHYVEGLQAESLGQGDDMDNAGAETYVSSENWNFNFESLTADDVMQLEFRNPEVAYAFYNEFSRNNGFSVRRSKIVKNGKGEAVRYTYVCSREGYREEKWLKKADRKREHKIVTRCGCEAEMRIKVDQGSGRWYVSLFNNNHNHEMVRSKHVELLRSHRKMFEAEVAHMNSMREIGISIPKTYQSFASQSRGFNLVGFRKRDLYNQVRKERNLQDGDDQGAFKYLESLAAIDRNMFWRFKQDGSGALSSLFWADGISRMDYSTFGDILAFDATYGRNKYKFPLVVFSGVNNHNQTCVFGTAMVSDEYRETYVWVLEQFIECMNGKAPKSVTTDGDNAMRYAIRRIFPCAHHRLCAWHLLRNATVNVSNPRFTQLFKACMLGDIEVDEFELKWEHMVEECGVGGVEWVQDLYKKFMWATAYIRGRFFAGLRTTSRCESLHSKVGKFVERRHNLTEFLPHFQRCVEQLRYNELEAEFKSCYGHPVLQTKLKGLEKSGAEVYTREIFYLYHASLQKSITVKIVEVKETAVGRIYTVGKYRKPTLTWHVLHNVDVMELKCSCARMESFGIPCIHIIAVLVHLDVGDLPKNLVLDRWSKSAKQCVEERIMDEPMIGDSMLYKTRVGSFVHHCKRLAKVACLADDDYYDMWDKFGNETLQLEMKHGLRTSAGEESSWCYRRVKDPEVTRSKSCVPLVVAASRKIKRKVRCGLCKCEGHTRTTCMYMGSKAGVCDQSGIGGGNEDDFCEDVDCSSEGRRIRPRNSSKE